MEIIIKEIERAKCNSFTMFAEPNLELLKETKEVEIHVGNHTKTRVTTSMYFGGNYSTRINMECEGFKTHEERESNYFSGGITVSNYFVKSKAQNKEVYLNYLKAILNNIMLNIYRVDIDVLTVNVYFRYEF